MATWTVDPVFGLTRRQLLTLAAVRDEMSSAVARKFGVTPSAIRHRKRRALAKLTPEQREYFDSQINRPRNRRRVRAYSATVCGVC